MSYRVISFNKILHLSMCEYIIVQLHEYINVIIE